MPATPVYSARFFTLLRITLLVMLVTSVGGQSATAQTEETIIFSSDRDTDGRWQLYAMDGNGDNVRRLYESEGIDFDASLSPDGTTLLFARRNERGYSEIFTAALPDGDEVRLIEGTNPAWSPDGTEIAYTTIENNNAEVFLMSATGFERRPFTSNPARDYAPAWSPDGEFIAFKSDRETETDADSGTGLYIALKDRTGLRRLTDTDDATHAPAWSPDGSEILFTRRVDGRSAIHVVDVETGDTRRLLENETSSLKPRWAAGGTDIVFVSIVDSQPDIFRMDADGENLIRLTDSAGWDWSPSVFAP
ncbi:MAG: hypothetical protein AAFU54_06725 [Chloroflexota bacterium]